MEVLRRAEKMATEAYPEATRDPNKVSIKRSFQTKNLDSKRNKRRCY